MKTSVTIELLEENGKVGIYSPRFAGETDSEFIKFVKANMGKHKKDVLTILARIDKIKEEYLQDRFVRYEGSRRDRVAGLPAPYIDKCGLRVYIICISGQIIILGGGGFKNTRTYNESPEVSEYVRKMQVLDEAIRIRQNSGAITSDGCQLDGELTFEIDI